MVKPALRPLSRKEEIARDFLVLAEEYIEKLKAGKIEKRWHAKEFAAALFIDSRHLTNTLKETLNQSPCDILEAKVLQACQQLLADDTHSIADISYRLAFDDPTNFTKFFKGISGTTPRQFRKSLQEKKEILIARA